MGEPDDRDLRSTRAGTGSPRTGRPFRPCCGPPGAHGRYQVFHELIDQADKVLYIIGAASCARLAETPEVQGVGADRIRPSRPWSPARGPRSPASRAGGSPAPLAEDLIMNAALSVVDGGHGCCNSRWNWRPCRHTAQDLSSFRPHLCQDAVQQLQQDDLDLLLVGGDTGQYLGPAIQAQRVAHVLQLPGILHVLLVGGHHVGRGCIGPECLEDGAGLPECFGAGWNQP